jgi:hypothetical protein
VAPFHAEELPKELRKAKVSYAVSFDVAWREKGLLGNDEMLFAFAPRSLAPFGPFLLKSPGSP